MKIRATKKCPDCGGRMKLVTAITPRANSPAGKPLEPIRYVCRCGKLVKA